MAGDAAARLYQALVNQDASAAISVIEQVRSAETEPGSLFESLFAPALSLLGGAWAAGTIDEYTFTQGAVVAEQIGSFVMPSATAQDTGVTVILGTMHRDHHSIDRNIIAAALKEAGHRVIDLGVDVRPAEFAERIDETGARIVIVCAQMMSTARSVDRVRQMFLAEGLDDVVILVSGGPFAAEPSIAKAAGANGIIGGAESALKLVARVARDLRKGGLIA